MKAGNVQRDGGLILSVNACHELRFGHLILVGKNGGAGDRHAEQTSHLCSPEPRLVPPVS